MSHRDNCTTLPNGRHSLTGAGLALGALDGRYKSATETLVDYLSEAALNRDRVHVEVEWFIYLCDHSVLPGLSPLTDAQRERVLGRLAESISGTVITISASEHRSQRRNRTAARQRLTKLLRDAVVPPVSRRSTRPTRGSLRRRLEGKRRRSQIKATRRRPAPE